MLFGLRKKRNSTSNANKTLIVNKERCPQNHSCPTVQACPAGALKQSGFRAPKVNQDKCIRCGKCVKLCPMHALTMDEPFDHDRGELPVKTITKENFQKEIMESKKPVLLDFWASWCGPCRTVSPLIEEIATENVAVKVGKINVDEQRELARTFHIRCVPTLVVMKAGKVVQQSMGARSKRRIVSMLDGI